MVGGRELLLQGRIDRIDWDDRRTHFRVIDYKTGKAGSKAAFDGGKALQLPLYLHAAARLLKIAPDHGEAQYFYCTRRGEYKRKGVTGFEIMRRREELEEVLTTIAEGVDTGTFTPNPGNGRQNCRFCDYKDVCDARIDRIAERKKGDPRGAAFIALKDIS
jgi:ATP-dependent helicase/DNAse subunit B